jgi:hypothetical protein
MNNKQRTEKEHATEGMGCCKCTRVGEEQGVDLHSTFSKQTEKAEGLRAGG